MNDGERCVARLLASLGYTVYRNGWPDFLAERDGRIVAVEHKSFTADLSPAQVAVRRVLERVVPVVVIRTGRVASDGSRGFYNEDRSHLLDNHDTV